MSNLKTNFVFSEENLQLTEKILLQYPDSHKQSALIPLLTLAQNQNHGWISQDIIIYLAKFLNMHPIKIYEVVSFYTMFNLKPIGEHHIQICTNLPCWLRGSDELVNICKNKLNLSVNDTSENNKFTLSEVECLGACVNAPVVQINNDYYEDLSPDKLIDIINKLK